MTYLGPQPKIRHFSTMTKFTHAKWNTCEPWGSLHHHHLVKTDARSVELGITGLNWALELNCPEGFLLSLRKQGLRKQGNGIVN